MSVLALQAKLWVGERPDRPTRRCGENLGVGLRRPTNRPTSDPPRLTSGTRSELSTSHRLSSSYDLQQPPHFPIRYHRARASHDVSHKLISVFLTKFSKFNEETDRPICHFTFVSRN